MEVAGVDQQRPIRASQRSERHLLRLSFFLAALNLVWALPKSAFPAEPAVPITVLVYNHARVSPGILTAAERQAGRILGAAGIAANWIECPMRSPTADPGGPCLRSLESTDIMLRVFPAPTQNSFEDTIFGFAVNPILASVYYDRAVLVAKEEGAESDVRVILGCVIAHELGHLLLGSNSHSRTGIMQARWDRELVRQVIMGTLFFTAEQGKLMQAQARTRRGPQTRNPQSGPHETIDSTGPGTLVR